MTTNWKELESGEERIAFEFERGENIGQIWERAGEWFVGGYEKANPHKFQKRPVTAEQAKSLAGQIRKSGLTIRFDGNI